MEVIELILLRLVSASLHDVPPKADIKTSCAGEVRRTDILRCSDTRDLAQIVSAGAKVTRVAG